MMQENNQALLEQEPTIKIRFCREAQGTPQVKHFYLLENIKFSDDHDDGEERRGRRIFFSKQNIIKALEIQNITSVTSIQYFDGSISAWTNFPENNLLQIFSTQSYKYSENELPPNYNQGFGSPWIVDLYVKTETLPNVPDTTQRALSSKSQPLGESEKLEIMQSLVLQIAQSIDTHFPIIIDGPGDYSPNKPSTQYYNSKEHEDQVKILSDIIKSQSHIIKELSPLMIKETTSTVDLVFLHSEPLLQELQTKSGGRYCTNLKVFNNGLEIEKEFNDICRQIKKTKKKFVIRREVATFQNLKIAMTYRPKMLHVSCHGGFCNKANAYYLTFEDADKMCVLDKLTEEKLKHLLGIGGEHQVQVVFVSACHSLKLGELFKRVGVPVVIAINQFTPILDEVCRLFAPMFYSHMITGSSPNNAFIQAKNAIKASSIDTHYCCCNHGHELWCKWREKFKKNNEEAHKAHTFNSLKIKDCECYQKRNNLQSHEHFKYCKFYKNFKTEFGSINVLPAPQDSLHDKVCCCKPDFPHNEDSKFIIVKRQFTKEPQSEENKHVQCDLLTEEQAKELDIRDQDILNQPLFKLRDDGECIQDNKITIDQLHQRINPNMIRGRNYQISEIVNFINDRDQRLLHLHGPETHGISDIANYAGKYALNGRVELEGALYVEFNSNTSVDSLIRTIVKRMSELNQNIYNECKFSKEIIINIIGDRKYLLIINRRTEIEEKLKVKFNKFLKKIINRTPKTKLIVITPQDEDIFQDIKSLTLEIPLLELTMAVDLLIELTGKYKSMAKDYTDELDLSKHPILSLLPLDPVQIVQISQLVNSGIALDVILKETSKKDNINDPEIKQIYVGETLNISTVLNNQEQKSNFVITLILKELLHIYPKNKSSQENQLLYIICQMPNGLFEDDIDTIWAQIKGQNSEDWRVFFHKISEFQEKNYVNKQYAEMQKRYLADEKIEIEINKTFQLLTHSLDTELNKCYYASLPQTVEIINQTTKSEDCQKYFNQCLMQMAILSYQIITGYQIQKQKDIDIKCVSALYTNIQSFWRADYKDKIEEQLKMIAQLNQAYSIKKDHIENEHSIKFFQYLPNFLNLIDQLDKIPKEAIENFHHWSIQELLINTVSILLNLNWIDDVLPVLDKCEKIAQKFQLPKLEAKLNILLVSARLREGRSSEGDLIKILQIVEDTFQETQHEGIFNEGLGQALYLQAIIQIERVIEKESNTEETKESEKLNPLQFKSIPTTLQTEGFNNQKSSITKSKIILSQRIKQLLIIDIIEKLQKVKQYFKETIYKFGVAKALLLEAEFLTEINFNSNYDIHSDKITMIQEIIKICNHLNECLEIFQQLQLRTLEARTLKQLGLLWYRILLINQNENNGSNLKVKDLIKSIQELIMKSNTGEVQTSEQQLNRFDKSKQKGQQTEQIVGLLIRGNFKDTAIHYFVSALSMYQILNDKVQQDQLLILINSTLELVTINNLIIFASAFPLVEKTVINSSLEDASKIQAIGSLTKIESDIKKLIIDELKQSRYLVNIKFDILNRELIEHVKNNGCKILHITSTVCEEDHIFMEDINGIVDSIHIDHFKILLKPIDDGALQIDLVVIAIPQSEKLAQVFIDLGVQHVVAFTSSRFTKNPKSITRELCYIEAYCIRFYHELLKHDGNVHKSFQKTKDANYSILEFVFKQFIQLQHKNFMEQLKDSFQYQESILCTKSEMNIMAQTKGLFDDIAQQSLTKSTDRKVDMSKQRKPNNLDVYKQKSPFTGCRQFIYELIQVITQPDVKIINMFGLEGIGKTRIALELSHYLSERDILQNGTIMYVDLKSFNSSSELKVRTQEIINQGINYQLDDDKLYKNHLILVFDHFDDIKTKIRSELFRNVSNLLHMNKNIKVIIVSRNKINQSDNESQYNTHVLKQVPPLNSEEVVDLILNTCMSDVSKELKKVNEELIGRLQHDSVSQFISSNDLVKKCYGFPKYILMLSKLMQTQNLNDIKTFQGSPSHQFYMEMQNYYQQAFNVNKKVDGVNNLLKEERDQVHHNVLIKQSQIRGDIQKVNKQIEELQAQKTTTFSIQMKKALSDLQA